MSTEQVTLSSEPLVRWELADSLWLEGTEDALQENGVLQDWRAWSTQAAARSIYLHPDLVLAAARAKSLIYVHSCNTPAGPARPACLAALAPKARQVRLTARLP